MPKPVSEQVVVISGASTGIGRATALAFAAEGAKVVCAARSKPALGTLAEQIRSDGGTAIAAPTDVADPAAVRSLADLAEAQYGRIDTWVNNAAVMVKPPPPVYAPEIVAATIVYAATHPRREIPVGGSAVGFLLGQRFSPGLTYALLSIRRLGVGTLRTDRPDNGRDNVDGPVDGPGRVHGSYPARVLQRNLFTRLIGRRARPGELATAAVSLLQRKLAKAGPAPVHAREGTAEW